MTAVLSPDISIIVISPDLFDTVRRTLRCLQTQSVKERMEIVLVLPAGCLVPEEEFKDFFGHTVVYYEGPMRSSAWARALGVRRASASVVVFTEEHAFPMPGWAQALIRRHEGPWAAVGPAMVNANPTSAISCANMLLEYSEWLDDLEGGEREHLPGHNGSYKRDLLLSYGPRLESMIEAESVLQWDLREKGHRLYLEPAARTRHFNVARLSASIPLRFHVGRLFASFRAGQQKWSFLRRLAFTLGSPLIPLVRLKRILSKARVSPDVLGALIFVLHVGAFGEMLGYAFGPGKSAAKSAALEFHRERYI